MEPGDHDPADGIPEILHSTRTEQPFESCVECEGPLLESGVPYVVDKVVRAGEVVFEYALCAACTQAMLREFSEESLQRIQEYLAESPPEILEGGDLDRCHRCGKADDDFREEHSLSALLIGHQLLMGITVLCAPCTEGLEAVLSRKTRDIQDDFITRNFPGVPTELDLPIGALSL